MIRMQTEAYVMAAQFSHDKWMSDLSGYVENEGVGQIPEVFEAEPPAAPCGRMMAEAWSIAELLRTCVEDLYVRPRAKPKRTRVAAYRFGPIRSLAQEPMSD